jgi:1-acyl-sn-glycerol-3-phosphate acyltransferase
MLSWLPLLAVIRLFDRTPAHMHTGLWFRRLGRALTRVNASWTINITGSDTLPAGGAFVVVSNHQSLADIPLLSNLKWEMKWVAKKELFETPVIGWMLRLAGDIPVDRKDARSGARMLISAMEYLKKGCPVMFFPEGTRSVDGEIGPFGDGAFHLAIRAQVPILPLCIEGSHLCLPKKSWMLGAPASIRIRVFEPVTTSGLTKADIQQLKDHTRTLIAGQINAWRASTPGENTPHLN